MGWGGKTVVCMRARRSESGDENHLSYTITSRCQIPGKALHDWMRARQARPGDRGARLEEGWRETKEGKKRTSEAREVESEWENKKRRRKTRTRGAAKDHVRACIPARSVM